MQPYFVLSRTRIICRGTAAARAPRALPARLSVALPPQLEHPRPSTTMASTGSIGGLPAEQASAARAARAESMSGRRELLADWLRSAGIVDKKLESALAACDENEIDEVAELAEVAAGNKLAELGFKPLTLQRIEAALAVPPDGGHPIQFELAVAAFAEESIGGFRLRVAALGRDAVTRFRAAEVEQAEVGRIRAARSEAALEHALGHDADPQDPDPGTAIFRGEMARVRVDGEVLAAHLTVLGQLSYFEAYLARWANGRDEPLDLELPEPCSSDDFLALLRRLYGLKFELASLGATLRVALVASVLGADGAILAQIRSAIPKLVATADDAAAVRAFLSSRELPAVFADLCPAAEVPMSSKEVSEMVMSATMAADGDDGTRLRQVAAAVVAGRQFPDDLIAPHYAFRSSTEAGFRWFLALHAEHVPTARRIEFFRRCSFDSMKREIPHAENRANHLERAHALTVLLQEDFAHHLRSYPSTEAVLIAANACCPNNCPNINEELRGKDFRNASLVDSPAIRAALAIAVRQGGEIAAVLSFASASSIRAVLDVEVLSALEEDVPCLTKLMTDSDIKQNRHQPPGKWFWEWVGVEIEGKLAVMSHAGRRAVCVALSSRMCELEPAVVAIVESELVV